MYISDRCVYSSMHNLWVRQYISVPPFYLFSVLSPCQQSLIPVLPSWTFSGCEYPDP